MRELALLTIVSAVLPAAAHAHQDAAHQGAVRQDDAHQDAARQNDAREYVVHEWGTFTSVAGRAGAALEWRPLAGPSDLPGFVYGAGDAKPGVGLQAPSRGRKKLVRATVRMETPVVYFYAEHALQVRVKVGFPRGTISEWYPHARSLNGGIDWGLVHVLPGLNVPLPREDGPSHYYPARETDAATVLVGGGRKRQYERFLFYRGLGTFPLPVSARLEGRRVRCESSRPDEGIPYIVFENRRGKKAYGVYALYRQKNGIPVPRPLDGGAITWADADHEQALLRLLRRTGLYEKEAKAMLATWRDRWFEEGLRVFYLVPRRVTDEVLPITLSPKPKQLVRVLVGRIEIVTPEMERAIESLVSDLGARDWNVRQRAQAKLARYGRFAEPVLERLLGTVTDFETRARIEALIGGRASSGK